MNWISGRVEDIMQWLEKGRDENIQADIEAEPAEITCEGGLTVPPLNAGTTR